jgi:hypothetical protein
MISFLLFFLVVLRIEPRVPGKSSTTVSLDEVGFSESFSLNCQATMSQALHIACSSVTPCVGHAIGVSAQNCSDPLPDI